LIFEFSNTYILKTKQEEKENEKDEMTNKTDKSLKRQLKIKQHKFHLKADVNSGVPGR
jgi:hypothetical protein